MIRRRVCSAMRGCTSLVALTFDDGPDPEFTPRLLDELARLRVTATFFLIGARATRHASIVERICAEGHAIGSHSNTHAEPGGKRHRVVTDFVTGRRAVERAARRRVRLFRPPKGYIGSAERWAMAAARVEPWLWTIDTMDWEPGTTAAGIVAQASAMQGGDVILLHDAISGPLAPSALDRSATVEAVAGIVESGRARGLEFSPLPAACA